MSLQRLSIVGILVLIGAISSSSCTTTDTVKPSNGGTPSSVVQQQCASFCQHLRTMGCREGEPLQDGTSCEVFCVNTQEAGHNLNIPCVLQTQSCTELQRCNR